MAQPVSKLSIFSSRWWSARLFILSSIALLCYISFTHRSDLIGSVTKKNTQLGPLAVLEQIAPSTNIIEDANLTLYQRDEFACKKGIPCKQYACCGGFGAGDIGECGLGPTWCGADCDSQCNAKAECGSWADPPGKTCPLNTCCSEFGFCGSTSDFCTKKCQSNCVLDPPVPPGGSSSPVLNKVIGYYESWSSQRPCHAFPPSALPVDGLTHVNFAFAYIDPESLKITPMDSSTPEDLFTQTTDVRNMKSGNAALEVFISIGGWTFSDNGTSTQGIFPSIAADAGKRQRFADNLVSFMKQYGFDGIDIDWEYPGAPDRGGTTEDKANYVKLLQTLRNMFSRSERGSYGISFTIPSSYWYLRWFDLPAMAKYVDWINLMSYDLHGVWDRNNPIGSIVQGHTNLTEIQMSVDLLWRVGISPAQIVLGLGFYGRSFQLADPGCGKPGCKFKGAADAGPCTAKAGILGYFEIMDIITAQKPDVQYDQDAAVNYFQYGPSRDQWVSYDNSKTFQQKVDWANKLGLGGLMIWAVDLDDNDFSALTGLVGKSLSSFKDQLKKTQVTDAGHWASQNGQKCIMTDCLDFAKGPDGYAMAPGGNKFKDNCGDSLNRYIYCPLDAMPNSCTWRGSGSCHGQCHAGEVTLFHSPDGSTKCLKPGQQAFCCETNTWADLIKTCDWLPVGFSCPRDKPYDLTYRTEIVSNCPGVGCNFGYKKSHFCCGYNFQGCHWVGQGSCDDNECSDTDIELTLDRQGATDQACWWGRKKPFCCNTPKSLNPFLPVSLDKLFPTLPPVVDIPVFDKQTIASGAAPVGGSNPQAFGLVVIDGPEDAVTNLNKRDGSHIVFLSCEQDRNDGGGTAQFVCMDDTESSNCNDMHLGGLAGTIMRMPDDCGFATYAVAHSVLPSLSQTLPDHLRKRAPPNTAVYDLEYSYDFTLAKRDSGDIYLRVDYSDSNDYYDQVVAADHQKRTLRSRFWSNSAAIWRRLIQNLRVSANQDFDPSIENTNLDILLYNNDGSRNNCSDSRDGFLQLKLTGQVKTSIKWGVTMVGTIAPNLKLEEAYSYFDSNPKLAGTLSFNGKGTLGINRGNPQLPLLSSPMTAYEFSHPGIVSFMPTMNIEARLLGSGQIDGDFTVDIQQGNQLTFAVNQPQLIGPFRGSSAGNIPKNAFKGNVVVDTAKAAATSAGTVFALELLLETSLSMKVFQYDTSVLDAGASLNAKIPHLFRIASTGSSQLTVYDGDQTALTDVSMNGSIADWASTDTFAVGPVLQPQTIHTGSSTPPSRDPPKESGFAVFGGREYIQCSKSQPANITCPPLSDLGNIDPRFNAPDSGSGPFALAKRGLEGLVTLEKRRSGERAFDVTVNRRVIAVLFSHTYYTGGRELLQHNPNAGYYDLNNNDCVDRTWNPNAPRGAGVRPAAEHILELQTHPRFLEFIMGATVALNNGHNYHTTFPVIDPGVFATGGRYLTSWSLWDPAGVTNAVDETAADDVWRAYGDTNNAGHMINTEPHFNGLKATIFRGNDPIADSAWQTQNLDDTADPATGLRAIGAIRNVLGLFSYMNRPELHMAWTSSANGIRAALAHFQDRYNRNVPQGGQPLANLPLMWDEYLHNVLIPQIENTVQAWVERRINILIVAWDTARGRSGGQRLREILGILEALTELQETALNSFIEMSNLD